MRIESSKIHVKVCVFAIPSNPSPGSDTCSCSSAARCWREKKTAFYACNLGERWDVIFFDTNGFLTISRLMLLDTSSSLAYCSSSYIFCSWRSETLVLYLSLTSFCSLVTSSTNKSKSTFDLKIPLDKNVLGLDKSPNQVLDLDLAA